MKYPSSSRVTYPEDIECVWEPRNGRGGIFVGNLEASQNLTTLKKHGIKSVLTAAKDIQLRHPKSSIPYHLHIPGEDHERFDLSKYFNQSIDFIASSLKETNILVHCMAGVSRSVTLVLAYLMKHHNMTYQQAYQAVKSKRKIINPNKGFIRQLLQFQRSLQNQNKAMRKSHDHFEAGAVGQSRDKISRSGIYPRQADQSFFRDVGTLSGLYQSRRYMTMGGNTEQKGDENSFKHQYSINSKYQIPRHRKDQQSAYSGYNDLNRELDEKIASIRKKYMEATDLLNRQEKKKGNMKFASTNYFRTMDRSEGGIGLSNDSFMKYDQPSFKKASSAIDTCSRSSSYANYLNSRKGEGYMYYNY